MSQPNPEDGLPDALRHLGDRLAALVDGELETDARERVLTHLATCPKCKAEVDAQRRLKAIFDKAAPPPLSQAIVARLQAVMATKTLEVGLGQRARPARKPRAERWASFAARIAGDRRAMRSAWLADLHGSPEDGVSLTPWQQRRYALGVLVAALRFFLRDSLGRLWRPVDWVLGTRNRRETFIGLPPALLVLYIAKHDGLHTLLTEGWGWVGGCGIATFALVRWLQRVRGIELADSATPESE